MIKEETEIKDNSLKMMNFLIFGLLSLLVGAVNSKSKECQSITAVYSGIFQYSDDQPNRFYAYIKFKLDADVTAQKISFELLKADNLKEKGYGFGLSNNESTS